MARKSNHDEELTPDKVIKPEEEAEEIEEGEIDPAIIDPEKLIVPEEEEEEDPPEGTVDLEDDETSKDEEEDDEESWNPLDDYRRDE